MCLFLLHSINWQNQSFFPPLSTSPSFFSLIHLWIYPSSIYCVLIELLKGTLSKSLFSISLLFFASFSTNLLAILHIVTKLIIWKTFLWLCYCSVLKHLQWFLISTGKWKWLEGSRRRSISFLLMLKLAWHVFLVNFLLIFFISSLPSSPCI